MRKVMLAATAALSTIGATSAAFAADTVIVQWNDVSLDAIRVTHPGPPIVARMLAVVDTCSDRFGGSFTQKSHASRVEPLTTPATDFTLTWRTFTDAANEAGISRRYGRIHFIPGDLDGRAAGHQLGAREWKLAKSYFDGHPGVVEHEDDDE